VIFSVQHWSGNPGVILPGAVRIGPGKEQGMSEKEKRLREQLEEEARAWVKKEFERRFQIAKETMEKQGRESEAHLNMMGISDTSRIASETQMSISYAKSELMKDLQFEAENWVEEELKKRLGKKD
jgi:DNA-binding helix-hairpin-helix protein with protein kinase domain